jgi:hypothetical protein
LLRPPVSLLFCRASSIPKLLTFLPGSNTENVPPELAVNQMLRFRATVVPGNSDLVDKLGVEPHPFLHTSFYVDGHSGSPAGLPPLSGRPSDGGARSSPSTQRFAALGEAAEVDHCGSIALGPAVAVLDRLAVCPGDRETGDGDRLAP